MANPNDAFQALELARKRVEESGLTILTAQAIDTYRNLIDTVQDEDIALELTLHTIDRYDRLNGAKNEH